MTPRPAVALNLAQLVARLSQSRLSRRKESTVVPQCISALAKMMAECETLLRTSVAALTLFRICARSCVLGCFVHIRQTLDGAISVGRLSGAIDTAPLSFATAYTAQKAQCL